MNSQYEVTVVSVKDGVPAYITAEFEKYHEALTFALRYDKRGSTPSIRSLLTGYYFMIGGLAA